jgi:ABC-2 type transport system ATP-binding protein
MSAAVALEGIAVERGATRVVHDIALEFAGGRWFGLIGANGSGKTSLLRAVA